MIGSIFAAIKKIWRLIPHKGFLFAFFLASLAFFLFVLFPTRELNDLITTQIANLTGNTLYVELHDFSPRVIPLGLKVDGLRVDGHGLNDFRLKALTVEPSIMGMISRKPFGTVEMVGLFGGNAEVSLSKGKMSDNGLERFQLNLAGSDLRLNDINETLHLQIPLSGKFQIDSKATIEPTMAEQPDAEMTIKIEKLELASSQVNTMMGPLPLPEMKLSTIELVGRLSNGKFVIEKGLIGKTGDELQGTLKGEMELQIKNDQGRFYPAFGGYKLTVDLVAKKAFEEKAKLFLTLIDNYKSESQNGANYRFSISATQLGITPQFTGIH